MDWLRFRNTYLQLPWLFPLVIGDRQFDAVLEGRPRNLRDQAQRALEKLLWFWPRVIDASVWAKGAPGKSQTPLAYRVLDAYALLLLDWVQRVCPDRDAAILDLGCNCGRHLVELAARGYRNLIGVDAMRSALALFAERTPDIFNKTEIHHDLFQRFLARQPDARFEVTYSHGSTIELVHPSFDVVAHMCRVTQGHICLILNENELYRRDWIEQFARAGFALVHAERPIESSDCWSSLLILART
jgi:SAM-dependent methyltransferase